MQLDIALIDEEALELGRASVQRVVTCSLISENEGTLLVFKLLTCHQEDGVFKLEVG